MDVYFNGIRLHDCRNYAMLIGGKLACHPDVITMYMAYDRDTCFPDVLSLLQFLKTPTFLWDAWNLKIGQA